MTQTVLLGDIADINSESVGKNYPFNSIMYLDTSSVTENTFSELQPFDIVDAPSRAKRIVKNGDIVYSTVRPNLKHFGYINNPLENTVASTGFAVIRSRKDVDSKYLYYWLASDERTEYLTAIADSQTSTFPAFNPSVLGKLKIELPDLATQKKIADILGAIDEKIELNRRMNETLEQMGQALFRHHFIDNPEAEKWEEGTLGDLFEIIMGQSPPGSSYNENGEGVTFYQGRAEFGVRFPNKRLSTIDPKRLAKRGDVLLSVRAPVGDINQATEDCCIGRGLASISSNNEQASFCYYTCRNLQSKLTEYNSEGTVFGAINGKQLKSLAVRMPPKTVILEFEKQAQELDEQILSNAQQIQTLTTLRDTLLPRLISGEVEV